MSCGYYDSNGRPYIDGVVFLPENPRLGRKPLLPISFLVDSGADRTLVVPSDYEPRGVEFGDFRNYRLSDASGFGGTFEARLVKCTLIVASDHGQQRQLAVTLEIARPSPAFENAPLPSVLGRDVLDAFQLTLNRQRDLVHLEALSE